MAVDIGPRIFDLLSALPELNLRWMVLLGPRVKVMAVRVPAIMRSEAALKQFGLEAFGLLETYRALE